MMKETKKKTKRKFSFLRKKNKTKTKKRRTKNILRSSFLKITFPPMMMMVVHSSDKKKKKKDKKHFMEFFFDKNHFPPMMMMVVESNKKPIFKRVFSEDHLSHFPTLSAKFIKKKESGFQLGILYFFILNLENLVLISLPSHSRERDKKKTKFRK